MLDIHLFMHRYSYVYVCLGIKPVPPHGELPRVLSRRYEVQTQTLIWHTSSGRRMKRIFKHRAVWRTLIHISSRKAHPVIMTQINWAFTRASIDLENISVLHSLLFPKLTQGFYCSWVSIIPSLGFSRVMAWSGHYDRVSPGWSCQPKEVLRDYTMHPYSHTERNVRIM